jgi:3-oxoacyl-[acyl-carrier-protein] synthase-1
MVLVAGLGARTSIGMTARSSAAAARAGIAGFGEHPFMIDTAGNRMVVAMAPYLASELAGTMRLGELAAPAGAEALAPLAATGNKSLPLPLFLGLPPHRPGRESDVQTVADQVCERVNEAGFTIGRVATIETGHAAGTTALLQAWQAIRSGAAHLVLAGGVDTYLEPETLEWLEAEDQILSAGPENNPHGFIPGEAAAFALLASAAAADHYSLDVAVELGALALSHETKLIKTGTVCIGEGLSDLFRRLALSMPQGSTVDDLYCDMNGEPYRADEFGFASIRAGRMFKDASEFTAPADCWGDVGAASGPLFLMLADAAARGGYASGALSAGFTSSESGERAGFIARAVREANGC